MATPNSGTFSYWYGGRPVATVRKATGSFDYWDGSATRPAPVPVLAADADNPPVEFDGTFPAFTVTGEFNRRGAPPSGTFTFWYRGRPVAAPATSRNFGSMQFWYGAPSWWPFPGKVLSGATGIEGEPPAAPGSSLFVAGVFPALTAAAEGEFSGAARSIIINATLPAFTSGEGLFLEANAVFPAFTAAVASEFSGAPRSVLVNATFPAFTVDAEALVSDDRFMSVAGVFPAPTAAVVLVSANGLMDVAATLPAFTGSATFVAEYVLAERDFASPTLTRRRVFEVDDAD